MRRYDLVIKNGQVVLEDEVRSMDIGIKEGVIVALSEEIAPEQSKEIMDAEGMHVLPGMIDVHVHFDEPNREHWEGFDFGSNAMAAGGCTTYFDMPLNGVPPTTTAEAFLKKKDLAEAKSLVHYGLWGGLVPGNKKELAKMANLGAIGFKAFMSEAGSEFDFSDDQTLYEGMKEIARLNKVLALHAERDDMIKILENEKKKHQQTSIRDYLETRPIEVEVEAVKRALYYGEKSKCPLHFVHISSKKAVELIHKAKKKGLDVTLETCPHYLIFTEEDFETMGVTAKCAPPLRPAKEREHLWECIEKNQIDMISSDHSPCPLEMKIHDKDNLFSVWGGISGGQYSLQAIVSEGYQKRGISLSKLVQLMSTAPAKRFGLYPEKGSILLGADADLVIIRLNEIDIVQREKMAFRHPYSIYEGYKFHCKIKYTVCKGEMVYTESTGTVKEKKGTFINGTKVKS
ncbi:allantoinase [Priestia megaterium]|nr:allantoinase [Priestia megaterium]